MPRNIRLGYDKTRVYSVDELEAMYLKEGKSLEEATKLAITIYKVMNSLNARERRSWKRCHSVEIPLGLFERKEN